MEPEAVSRRQGGVLLTAVMVTHLLPHAMPEPTLAFYVLRGCFGVLLAAALLLRWRVWWPVLAVVALNEGSTAVCGSLYVVTPAAMEFGLCDAGTGLPLTLPACALALLVLGWLIDQGTKK